MIIKPFTVKAPANVTRLARHLLRTDENEIAQVADVRHLGARPELADMLHAMHRTRQATRGERGLFHVAINPDNDQAHGMNGEQWERTLAAIEEEFSLSAQPRVVVLHHKKQPDGSTRPHIHAVYQIADVERGRQVDWFENSGRRCGRVARQLEQELGHQQLPDRSPRRSYDRARHQQAKKQGRSVEEQRATVREAWSRSDSAAAFRAALQAKGYDLAEGRRGALLVTPEGAHIALARELEGVKAKDVRQRLEGLKLEPVEAVQQRHRERGQQRTEAEPGQLSGERPPASVRDRTEHQARSQQREEQFRESSADTQGKPATDQERAEAAAQSFAENRRETVNTERQRAEERAQQFAENRRLTFEELYGKAPEHDQDQGLEHEL